MSELSLVEWCGKLPSGHRARLELAALTSDVERLNGELTNYKLGFATANEGREQSRAEMLWLTAECNRYKSALERVAKNGWPLEMRNIALVALAEAVRG